jgi:kinetochore protein Nuf2
VRPPPLKKQRPTLPTHPPNPPNNHNSEELNQPVFAAIDAFEWPELHDASVAARNLHRALRRLLAAAGCRDFGLRDVYKPEPVRLRRQLSAVVNFAKFREEKLQAYAELQAQLEGAEEGARRARLERRAAEQELAAVRAARDAERGEAAAVESEADALTTQNQALSKQIGALLQVSKQLKAQGAQQHEAAQADRAELSERRADVERLQGQVVQSPERFQRTLQDMQRAVEQERGLVADADRRCAQLQLRGEAAAKAEREVARCCEAMAELEADIGRKKEASRRVKALRERISRAQGDASEVEARAEHLKRQQTTLQDRIRRLESQAALRKDAAASSLEEKRRDREVADAEGAVAAARRAQLDAGAQRARDKAREILQQHEQAVAAVLERYARLRAGVASFNARMAAATDAASARLSALQQGQLAPQGQDQRLDGGGFNHAAMTDAELIAASTSKPGYVEGRRGQGEGEEEDDDGGAGGDQADEEEGERRQGGRRPVTRSRARQGGPAAAVDDAAAGMAAMRV